MRTPDQITLDVEGIVFPFDVFAGDNYRDVLCPLCGKPVERGFRMLQWNEATRELVPRAVFVPDWRVCYRPIHTRCARRRPDVYRETW